MKIFSWIQIILDAALVGLMGYVLYWSFTGLVDKLEGPAFAGQTDASVWLPVHPAFVTFARWLVPVVAAVCLAALVISFIQVRRGNGGPGWATTFQLAAGCFIAAGAFLVLLAVKPNQWLLSNGQGTTMLDMAHPMWKAEYAVIIFCVIIVGIAVAAVAVIQQTLANRPEAPAVYKPGWKRARNAARRHR